MNTRDPSAKADDEDTSAIQEAIDDLANGDRGMPFEEFDRQFRERHNLPPARPFPWHCPKCRRKEVRRVTIPYQCERLHEG